jgi:hypothetical protein
MALTDKGNFIHCHRCSTMMSQTGFKAMQTREGYLHSYSKRECEAQAESGTGCKLCMMILDDSGMHWQEEDALVFFAALDDGTSFYHPWRSVAPREESPALLPFDALNGYRRNEEGKFYSLLTILVFTKDGAASFLLLLHLPLD